MSAAPASPRPRRRGGTEEPMVPPADVTSYYGHPVVKPAPWTPDIPAYLFLGGLAAGSSLLAAGGDLSGRPVLRRRARLSAAIAVTAGLGALVHDLGRPARFAHMLRVAKPTSPMSVGTWLLSPFAAAAGVAAAAELPLPDRLHRLLPSTARVSGLAAAALAPAIASYTAVLLSDTATPAWHHGHRELPFVFVSSAAAAAAGLAMIAVPEDEAAPARRLGALAGAAELFAERHRARAMGIAAETLTSGAAGRLLKAARWLTGAGAAAAAIAGHRRAVAAVGGAALLAGSASARFGIFEAGQASARDPRYTIGPQRERLDAPS